MNKQTAPTLEDVARLAGVSTASISRALNAPSKVAPATREKIEKAVEVLGYTPNFGGRALASGRANTVGAVIPSMANAMFANGLQAFQDVLSQAKVNLLVATTGFDPEEELAAIKSLVAHGADGLMLIGNARPDATWDFLDKRQVPHVVAWVSETRPGHLFAGFDNAGAAADAARRALAAGHRRIAMICGQTRNNDRARARRDGVIAAVAAWGDGARLTHLIEAPYMLDESGAAFATIMRQQEIPTVVLCGNDAQAAGAMAQARAMGLSLPDDMSFIGFDDIGLARVLHPALATVRVPQFDMGHRAAALLLDRIEGREDLQSVVLDTEFMDRASLAPPREA
ncbi:LacI family DNA-binding transcriptional regulator [Roseobacter ponti]|uniref:LacI family DNA-binding transcriptional regulator n=1 Tax=Roseobacter ponti TaxID=1891787 RepID=A0A858SRQ7_9RHOB|nr:LacI family DNA-binding transcriptional regulator [Roseobacter ponti]QJF50363.1 LacI family DNA-binding transcriptional regulator [Roseobacter ponti]